MLITQLITQNYDADRSVYCTFDFVTVSHKYVFRSRSDVLYSGLEVMDADVS